MFLLFAIAAHYITFDVYGTLLNTKPKKDAIRQIAIDNNYSDPDHAYKIYNENEDHCVYGDIYSDWDKKISRALFWTDLTLNTTFFNTISSYHKILDAYYSYRPFPEVVDTLKEMKNRGYTIVIMSNSADVIMNTNRKAMGDVFENCILGQEAQAFKPSLKFFKYVHNKLDFDHNNHTHIAQGIWADIFPATQIGWTKIWVNRNNERVSSEFDPYHAVSNLSETLQYLPPLNNHNNKKNLIFVIVGISVAALMLLIALICIIFVFVRRKKQPNKTLSAQLTSNLIDS